MAVRIAVISDIHCHEKPEIKDFHHSLLIAGSSRKPSKQHPTQALLELIDELKLRVDIVVCPGDITDQYSNLGFETGLFHIREIKSALRAKKLICTLGNHDVGSRRESEDSFKLARTVHPEYPLDGVKLQEKYWSEGFALHRFFNADFLVINSCIDHIDESTAKRGTFDDARIEKLEKYLGRISNPRPIRVAVMHHHPILHSIPDFPSTDVLANGDLLLEMLGNNNFQMVIHGHKHFPRIQRWEAAGKLMIVFCAGSFSAMLRELYTRTDNTFHIVELEENDDIVSGKIETWKFGHGRGWMPSTASGTEFPHIIRWGIKNEHLEAEVIKFFSENTTVWNIQGDEVSRLFPDFKALLPGELESLTANLAVKHGIEITVSEQGIVISIGRHYNSKSGV